MTRILAGLFVALAVMLAASPASAQLTTTVVAACGTPPANLKYTAGSNRPVLMDTNGTLCVNATVTVSASVTFPTIGAAVPGTGIYSALNVAGTLRGLSGLSTGSLFPAAVAIVDASGNQITSFGNAANIGATGSAVTASANYNGVNVAGTLRGLSGVATGSLFPAAVAIVDASGNQITTFGSSAAVGSTGSAVPASASYGGLNVGGTLRGATGLGLGSTFSQTVAIVDASGNQITSFGGSGGTASNFGSAFPSSGTAIGVSDGTNMIALRSGTAGTAAPTVLTVQGVASMTPLLATLSGTNNIATVTAVTSITNPVAATQSGTWNITNISGTVSLPTGASTAAKQPALGTAGSASTDVVTVQGIASMTPFLANPGTAANWGVAATGATVPANANYVCINTGGNCVGWTGAVTVASGGIASGAIASGAVASGAFASGALASGSIAAGAHVDLLTMRGTKAPGTAAANSMLTGGVYTAAGVTLTDGQQAALQFTSAGAVIMSVINTNANGQATMANSSPVVIASNQSTLPVNGSGTAGTANAGVVTIQGIASMTPVAVTDSGKNSNGQATMANSAPVAIANNQTQATTSVTCGSAVSSCVLKASAGSFYGVYANCTSACWLMVFNSTTAPSNGATTAGTGSGNLVECIDISAGSSKSLNYQGLVPRAFSTGITVAISSTACATLTLSTVGFVSGTVL